MNNLITIEKTIKMKGKGYRCLRCGHEWFPRIEKPNMCAKCKSIFFDKPKK